MSGAAPAPPPDDPHPQAQVHLHTPLRLIWLIPIVALAIAAYLGWRAIRERGPEITITFNTAEGLKAGQTEVEHKSVVLGTVQRISLSSDMSHVLVRVRMRREAEAELTSSARFWVVRPRLSVGNVSGLDTLLSGPYIEMDPGARKGPEQTAFTGLEEPPAVRSDEPGRTFKLTADRVGSLSSGSPVFYRDIPVGEVLGYEIGPTGAGITINVFVRSPYDKFVHPATHFWNASGLSVEFGAGGVHLEMESLLALLSGGVAFDTAADERDTAQSPNGASFALFKDQEAVASANFHREVPLVAYFQGSVRGLAVGAAVELYGIQIGTVTDVKLELDPTGASSRVAVHFEVQPERLMEPALLSRQVDHVALIRRLVQRGLRATLITANYLTGQLVLEMTFVPGAPPAEIKVLNGVIEVPSQAGGLDSITAGLSDVIQKLNRLPLEQIAQNLNGALQGVNDVARGPELRQSLQSMAEAMTSIDALVHKVDTGATPALQRLPAIAKALQVAVDRAGTLLSSADSGYGGNSEFRRDLERLIDQAADTARSVRLLTDYLDQHPEALLRGRSDQGQGR